MLRRDRGDVSDKKETSLSRVKQAISTGHHDMGKAVTHAHKYLLKAKKEEADVTKDTKAPNNKLKK